MEVLVGESESKPLRHDVLSCFLSAADEQDEDDDESQETELHEVCIDKDKECRKQALQEKLKLCEIENETLRSKLQEFKSLSNQNEKLRLDNDIAENEASAAKSKVFKLFQCMLLMSQKFCKKKRRSH
jgi:uncharacterized protein (DUF342 family)